MADIFMSYSSEDRERVIPLVEALEEEGFSVWWDRHIGMGASFDQEIEREIDAASCVVVVWSDSSVKSDWVRNESTEGQERGILVPIQIDDVRLPLAFRRVQTANLTGWPEIRNEFEFSQLVSGIRTHAGGVRNESSDQPGAQKKPRRRAVGTLRMKYAVRTDGARTAYAVMGDGPVLVIPPGGTTHIEWYTADTGAHEKFCARLAEHRTLVLYDRHGFGLSDRNRTDFTTEDDLKDLEAVIEAVGAPTLDFFGISWGGGPTLAYAAMHPERVGKIVLYGTGSSGRAGPDKAVVATGKSLAALRRADTELYCKTLALQFFPSGTDAETFASFTRMLLRSTTLEMAEKLDGVHLETQSLLSGINVPALVVHRRGDQCAKFEWGQYLARRLPNASFIPLDGDAHFPWVDDADSVLTPTIEFLIADER